MVADVLLGYERAGYLKPLSTLEAVESYGGGKAILTKVGAVKKDKVNPATGTVTTKCRIIVCFKQSKTTATTRKIHKSDHFWWLVLSRAFSA